MINEHDKHDKNSKRLSQFSPSNEFSIMQIFRRTKWQQRNQTYESNRTSYSMLKKVVVDLAPPSLTLKKTYWQNWPSNALRQLLSTTLYIFFRGRMLLIHENEWMNEWMRNAQKMYFISFLNQCGTREDKFINIIFLVKDWRLIIKISHFKHAIKFIWTFTISILHCEMVNKNCFG